MSSNRPVFREVWRVLNCPVFKTPHSFWVANENGVRQADALRTDTANRGCVSDIAIDYHLVFWDVTFDSGLVRTTISTIRTNSLQYGAISATFLPTGFTTLHLFDPITSISITLIETGPSNHEYGALVYREPQTRNVYSRD